MKYIQLLGEDSWVIVQAVGGLLVFIIAGITVAEGAILDLTQYTQRTGFINLQVTKMGVYTFNFLGESFSAQSILYIGKISSLDRKLLVDLGGTAFVVNTLPVFDARNCFAMLGTWMIVAKQGMALLLSDVGNELVKGYIWLAECFKTFFLL
jgi:hypothetical protein